ncbi:MAG: HU family DNA-binding protein [Elioraea sp.]|nr:HU family DNA-binding protein [Elioraea sp.]
MKIDSMIASVAEATQMPRKDVRKVVTALFDSIKKAVEAGEKVNVPGLGVFQQRERAAGERVNPKTGETVSVPAARFTVLKPSRSVLGLPKRQKAAGAKGAAAG